MLVPSSRPSPYHVVFVLGESLLIALAVALAVLLRVGDPGELFTWKYSWHRIVLVPIVLQATFFYFDLYNFRVAKPFIWTFSKLLTAVAVGNMALTVVYYIMPRLFLGRGVMVWSFFLVISVVTLWRWGYGWALHQRLLSTKVLMLGQGSIADAILEELTKRTDNVHNLVCILDAGPLPNNHAVLGKKNSINLMPMWAKLLRADYHEEYEDIVSLVRYYGANLVVVAMEEKRGTMPMDDLLRCRMQGLPIKAGEDFFESIAGRILADHVTAGTLIFSPQGFTTGGIRAYVKRLFDIGVSSVGLLLASPLALITALAIRIESKGPVLYSQERTGYQGKPFTIYKFRSMVADAEKASGPVWAQEEDPRITKVGRFIRKTRLDEIPQLWNVLIGTMSFVGPRPERPHFVEELQKELPFYAERHNVKPGVTGWAQICYPYGSSKQAALEKLNYDLYYIKHFGLSMDITILFQTVKILLFGGGGR